MSQEGIMGNPQDDKMLKRVQHDRNEDAESREISIQVR